jgi:alkaline phosphatase
LTLFTADHETGAFRMSNRTDLAAPHRQSATTEYMWGLIDAGAPIKATLKTYAGLDLTASEVSTIQRCGEHGIGDVLAVRWKVSWNGTYTQEGDHRSIHVPIWAWGPGHAGFAANGAPNEPVGQELLDIYS